MDARTPLMLRLEDLDREELLRLVTARQKSFPVAMFVPEDLLNARYDVAEERAAAALKKEAAAWEAYSPLCAVDPTAMTKRAYSDLLKRREAARLTLEMTRHGLKRAEGIRDRAWAALKQHWSASR